MKRRRLSRWLLLVAALFATRWATAQTDPLAHHWLQRIYSATQKLSYTGTFVYHFNGQVETSRITRVVDASGPVEKLESLDGAQREIIRYGDEVVCYLPATMTMKIDRLAGRKPFPAILPEQINDLSAYYTISRGGTERVAGFPCEIIVLSPRDKLRYGHKLWADRRTGMLLRAKTFNDRNEVMESFTFTQLKIGNIDRGQVRSTYASPEKAWRVENSSAEDANLAAAGWSLRAQPPGFRKIAEMRRSLGGAADVGHMVLSDGLAAVSIFIQLDAASPSPPPGLSQQGAINVYTRELGNHRITVVGETPAESVRFLADAVEHRAQ